MSLDHLRALLHSDTDLVDDWESALFEVARKACEALRASRALVALPEGDCWRAFVDSGQVLAGAAVSLVASNSVLAAAFADGPARETVTLNDLKRSGSMNSQSIHSVLAVVLRRHGHPATTDAGASRRMPIGVLYLDRRADLAPFDADDELWARDLAALTERSLTLIELLSQARRERDAARLESETLRTRQFNAELDVLESRDPRFLEAVGRVLSRAATADRVTVLLQGPTVLRVGLGDSGRWWRCRRAMAGARQWMADRCWRRRLPMVRLVGRRRDLLQDPSCSVMLDTDHRECRKRPDKVRTHRSADLATLRALAIRWRNQARPSGRYRLRPTDAVGRNPYPR